MKNSKLFLACALGFAITGCTNSTESTPDVATEAAPATPEATAPATPTAPTTRDSSTPDTDFTPWLTNWPGPEGSYLKIDPADGNYQIELANLDGPKFYKGTASGDHITFERDGKTETIRATDGPGTGMKYYTDKKDCLVINKGSEGFCRD